MKQTVNEHGLAAYDARRDEIYWPKKRRFLWPGPAPSTTETGTSASPSRKTCWRKQSLPARDH